MKTVSAKFALSRRSSVLTLVLLASCGGGGDGGGAPSATGAQEMPPNSSMATGNATAPVDPNTKAFGGGISSTGAAGGAMPMSH